MQRVLVLIMAMLASACGQQDIEDGEHVWKEQMQTMDKAREVEQTLQEADKRRREAAEAETN